MVGRNTKPGDRIFFHDHGPAITAGYVAAIGNREVSIQAGSRLLLKAREECFEDLAAAIADRMEKLTDEIGIKQKLWTNLAQRLIRLGEVVESESAE